MTFCEKLKMTLKQDGFAKCREIKNASAFLDPIEFRNNYTGSRPMFGARKLSTLATRSIPPIDAVQTASR